jgi:hypothetical protein
MEFWDALIAQAAVMLADPDPGFPMGSLPLYCLRA